MSTIALEDFIDKIQHYNKTELYNIIWGQPLFSEIWELFQIACNKVSNEDLPQYEGTVAQVLYGKDIRHIVNRIVMNVLNQDNTIKLIEPCQSLINSFSSFLPDGNNSFEVSPLNGHWKRDLRNNFKNAFMDAEKSMYINVFVKSFTGALAKFNTDAMEELDRIVNQVNASMILILSRDLISLICLCHQAKD